ncbi:hypothetical protein QLX08_002762 [Tetragonisca angustula]|uniref:Uncharacterized protein n=1 Tax=Tetragonisca angustula TaxID=166442 RepID=A0AAW1A9Y3_9HYME
MVDYGVESRGHLDFARRDVESAAESAEFAGCPNLSPRPARRFIETPSRVEVVYPSELFGPYVASNAPPANTHQPDDEE